MSAFHDGIASRTVYGEARGEVDEGKLAVACVIRNRVKVGHWGKTVAAVCLANKQYSCWNPGDPNRRRILEIADDDADLLRCAAAWLASETEEDPTFGATHYRVIGWPANWAQGLTPCATVGHHEFFRDVP